jgi:hypothetical protein
MLVGLPHFGFERPADPGENESPTPPHSSNESRGHFHQGGGEHVRDYKGPIAIHNIGATKDELQPIREVIQARILRSNFQRIGVDIQAKACGTPIISAVNARMPDPVPTSRTLSMRSLVKISSRASMHSAVVG